MQHDRAGEPPEDGPRPFSAADSAEQRLRAEAALSREELQETIGELVRRTDLRSTVRRRRATWLNRCRLARERIAAHQVVILLGAGLTTCCVVTIAVLRAKDGPCLRGTRGHR